MANTLFIGKVYHRFAAIASTNEWAKTEAAKNKPPEGTVVRADTQSAGRGQFGSRWESEPGANLTFSLILYPHWLEAPAQFWLSMAVAMGVPDGVLRVPSIQDPATSIQHPVSSIHTKWPNDL